MNSEIKIRFEAENRRAAAYDASRLVGECDVIMQKSFWIITHTDVDKAYGGKGIAGDLVASVMQAAKDAHIKVKPFCSYAAHQFMKNPDYRAQEDDSVIVVFGMRSCPDCSYVDEQVRYNRHFKIIEIGDDVKNLKAFIRLRDASPLFDNVKKAGGIGIPCFVMEDGTITLKPEEVGLKSRPSFESSRRLIHLLNL